MSAEHPSAEPHRMPVALIGDDDAHLVTAGAVVRAAGPHVTTGWRLPGAPWDLHPHAVVVTGSLARLGAEDELVAAVARGAGAVVAVPDPSAPPARLVDALQRMTTVVNASACGALDLDTTQVALLADLARGTSTHDAARGVHLSVRTAHRRLADARTTLGVTSTNCAIAKVVEAMRFWSS
jgi:hypothetical protein